MAQRLNFNTPERNKVSDWIVPPGEDYTRRLFDSSKKVKELKKNIVLIMPFFEEPKEAVPSETIISQI